jgi:hypothetical protein
MNAETATTARIMMSDQDTPPPPRDSAASGEAELLRDAVELRRAVELFLEELLAVFTSLDTCTHVQ